MSHCWAHRLLCWFNLTWVIYAGVIEEQLVLFDMDLSGFLQALEIMENLEKSLKKFHEWKNHGI